MRFLFTYFHSFLISSFQIINLSYYFNCISCILEKNLILSVIKVIKQIIIGSEFRSIELLRRENLARNHDCLRSPAKGAYSHQSFVDENGLF